MSENIINALEKMADKGKLMLTERELVKLGIYRSLQTARNDRWKGVGPPFIKLKRRVGYLIPDILEYLEENRVDPM